MDLGKLRLRGIIEINLVLGNLKVTSNTERAKDTNLISSFSEIKCKYLMYLEIINSLYIYISIFYKD